MELPAFRAFVSDLAKGGFTPAEIRKAFAAKRADDPAQMEVINKDVSSFATAEGKKTASKLALVADLSAGAARRISSGMGFGSYRIPPQVQAYVANAKLNRAVSWDPQTTEDYSHYPAASEPTGNMAWDWTLITPKTLADDRAAKGPFNRMRNAVNGVVTYVKESRGTGEVIANYDEDEHPDFFARGYANQKWANNVAILSDGSIDCLPAARREPGNPGLILTNPALSRGQELMFNGHLDIRNGITVTENGRSVVRDSVVVGIEMSGVLCKRAAKGEDNFIDPIGLMKAWGYTLADNLEIDWGNTRDGVPVRDAEKGVISQA